MIDRKIDVIAYAGSRGDESPRAFVLGAERIEISAVMERWIEESREGERRRRCFRVRGGDGSVHLVYHDEAEDQWFLSQ